MLGGNNADVAYCRKSGRCHRRRTMARTGRQTHAHRRRTLGLRVGNHSDNGVWTENDLPGGGCLALFKHPDPKSAAAPGGASIAFEVEDLDMLVARLKSEDVKFTADDVQSPVCRMAIMQDTEGNTIILHMLRKST